MKRSKKELKRFLIAGSCAVLTDFITYYYMLNFLSHNISKTISFLLGSVLSFIINKYWKFENKKKKLYANYSIFIFIYINANN